MEACIPCKVKKEALEQAVSVIRDWHDFNYRHIRSHQAETKEETWRIYYKNAPEMRPIRIVLGSNYKIPDHTEGEGDG